MYVHRTFWIVTIPTQWQRQKGDQQLSDIDSIVESPCIENCCLNDDDTCLGCFRSLEEIVHWHVASNQKRIIILQNAQQRRNEKLGDS